jgi:heme-degrading monooxygenase HmoA
MIVVVFRNRIQPGAEDAYYEEAKEVGPIAMEMPGYISHKVFTAQDGERATVVEYESEEAVRLWARHPRHVAAKKHGRQSLYADYKVQVCSVLQQRDFTRTPAESET